MHPGNGGSREQKYSFFLSLFLMVYTQVARIKHRAEQKPFTVTGNGYPQSKLDMKAKKKKL